MSKPAIRYHVYAGPLGCFLLLSDGAALTELHLEERRWAPLVEPGRRQSGWREDPAALAEVVSQLDEYFAGKRFDFDLPLDLAGTEFQRRVWSALCDIPYGETISYQTLATRIGAPKAVRAVGAANGRNPVAIIVPCHRVIGANGSLTGYGGGLPRKQALLALETRALDGRRLLRVQ